MRKFAIGQRSATGRHMIRSLVASIGMCLLAASAGCGGKSTESLGVTGQGGGSGTGGAGSGGSHWVPADRSSGLFGLACHDWSEVHLAANRMRLQIVLDASTKMNDVAPGAVGTKLQLTRDALVEAILGGEGQGLSDDIEVGLLYYPGPVSSNASAIPTDASTCLSLGTAIPIAPLGGQDADSQRSLLRAGLDNVRLGRGTPTADAVAYAIDNLLQISGPGIVAGDTHLLLVTNGMPTLYRGCYNPSGTHSNLPGDEVVQIVTEATAQTISTFAVGLPGAEEAGDWLSRVAERGNTARMGCTGAVGNYCHLDTTLAPDLGVALREAFGRVTTEVSRCIHEIPLVSLSDGQPVDLEKLTPIVWFKDNSALILANATATNEPCLDGYRIVSPTKLELCINTCESVRAQPDAMLDLFYGCNPSELATL